MDYQEYVSSTPTQVFFLLVIATYLIYRGLHVLNKNFVNNMNKRQKLQKALFFLEFLTWLVVTFEAIKYFRSNNTIITIALSLILLVVISWTAWFVIKDYVAGLYVKWNENYSLNDEIQIDNKKGKIIAMKSRYAVIELDPLHTMQIPYSKLFTKSVIKVGLSGLSSNVSFTLNLPDNLKPLESLEQIKTYIYQLPWINFKHEPMVLVEEHNANGALIRINASLIDLRYSEEFKNNLRNKFEQD